MPFTHVYSRMLGDLAQIALHSGEASRGRISIRYRLCAGKELRVRRSHWRSVFAACSMFIVILPSGLVPHLRPHVVAGVALSVPILHFAIDNDYYPEKQSPAQAAADFALLRRIIDLFSLYQVRDLDPALSTPIGDPTSVTFYQHTGVFTNAGKPKLAAHTYADLVRLLDGHRPAIEDSVTFTTTSGVPLAMHLHAWHLETGIQLVMLWNTLHPWSGTLHLPVRGTSAWLHEPDGTVHRVAGFGGLTIPHVELRAGAIPVLYEIRPS